MRARHMWPLLVAFLISKPAEATWSIVAVDPQSGDIGLAAATCNVGVGLIAEIVPGKGVVAAQAATSFKGRDQAKEWIAEGKNAEEILTLLSDPTFYNWRTVAKFPVLQYGVATLSPEPSAGFVGGDKLISWSGGEAANYYSVQGNTLRSRRVVEESATAFAISTDEDCRLTLAERLLRGIEAGRDAGGDKRCPLSKPAQSAILLIASLDTTAETPSRIVVPKDIGLIEATWRLVVPYKPGPEDEEPISLLRKKYTENGGRTCR